jgi:hypothetical protein
MPGAASVSGSGGTSISARRTSRPSSSTKVRVDYLARAAATAGRRATAAPAPKRSSDIRPRVHQGCRQIRQNQSHRPIIAFKRTAPASRLRTLWPASGSSRGMTKGERLRASSCGLSRLARPGMNEMRGFTLPLISSRGFRARVFLVRAQRLKYYLARWSFTLPDKFSSGASACLKGCPMRVASKSLEKNRQE